MKKYLMKEFILIILFVLIIGTHYSIFAASKKKNTSLNVDITSDGFVSSFNPTTSGTSTDVAAITGPVNTAIINITNPILGIIQVLGGILLVISIALYGFGKILSADKGLAGDLGVGPKENKRLLDAGRAIIIGAVLLFSSATLVKAVLHLFIK